MNSAPEIYTRPKIVGARIKRAEDPRLLTGAGAFTDDRHAAGMLHVAFRRSDQSHARIRNIDCAAARTAPGVVAVLTAEDLAETVKPLVAVSKMPNYYATPIVPLARGKVRYVGEPVVGVVAQSRYQAEDALDHVNIDYEPLPPIVDAEQAARRSCTRRPAPTCWSAANSSAARSTRRSRRRRSGCKAASACGARRRWRWSRARASPNTRPIGRC
jgi:carbon-monoxide dehydrogenase large subunit